MHDAVVEHLRRIGGRRLGGDGPLRGRVHAPRQDVEPAGEIGVRAPAVGSTSLRRGKRSSTPDINSEPTPSVVSKVYCAIWARPNLAARGAGPTRTGWISTGRSSAPPCRRTASSEARRGWGFRTWEQ